MGAETTKLSITVDANNALKQVAALFPEWSLAQLGNKLLLESCQAVLSANVASLPTLDYLRKQRGFVPTGSSLDSMIERLERAADSFTRATADAKKQPSRQRAA